MGQGSKGKMEKESHHQNRNPGANDQKSRLKVKWAGPTDPKMGEIGSNGSNRSKNKMGQDGSKSVKIDENGSKWVKLGQNGSKWVEQNRSG